MRKIIAITGALLLAFVMLFALMMPVAAQSSAAVTGIVFQDANGNGVQDSDETGLANVVIVAIEEDSGAPITAVSGADGTYRIEAEVINHRVRVDETSLPFNGELTTAQLEYNLNVPPGFTAPNVNFGYQEVSPSSVTGMVFRDDNGNGTQDNSESGLSGVTLAIVHDETGAVTTSTTGPDGGYRFEAAGSINHRVRVDTTTLPFNAQLTTGREEYNLNVPPGFTAPNVNFGYQEVQPAAATGTVFNDANGNGQQDDGESALSGVTVAITHDETGSLTTITTGSDGSYRFETSPRINHRVSVDDTTLPFTGQLTTGREEYNLNVPSGFTAPNVNFGYQETQPSAASGTVFEDLNGNGQQDDGEKGIPNATLTVIQRAGGTTATITTASDGTYRYETAARRFTISVDEDSLPFADPVLTTSRAEYRLNVPNGFIAPNVNFGYRAATPEDTPPLQAVGGAGGMTTTDPEGSVEQPDTRTNAFDNPDPQMPLPDDLPADAGEYALPREGTWTAYNEGLSLTCSGMTMDQPPNPPETGTIQLEDGGRTLIGTGYEGDTVILTASSETRGLYTGTITITEQGASVTLDYYLQVVTPERIIGYLTGAVQAQGVSCDAYRPFHMEYSGG